MLALVVEKRPPRPDGPVGDEGTWEKQEVSCDNNSLYRAQNNNQPDDDVLAQLGQCPMPTLKLALLQQENKMLLVDASDQN